MRKKAQANQKHNIAPHVLSREGYEYSEKVEEKDEEQAQQQCEKYSIVKNQQENILQSNNHPH